MLLKDYYKTLEVGPGATEQEIKKSFRRLVLRFHPDKNGGDAVAEARFREIREAYEILSDPQQREEYNYKRWYNRSLGKHFQAVPLTPQGILLECRRLQDYVRATGSTRVNYDGLSYHIRKQLLNGENIRLLRQFNNEPVTLDIILIIVDCCVSLPWRYIGPIADLLRQAANGATAPDRAIDAFVAGHQEGRLWNKYRIVLVIIVTALLCGLIYLLR